MNSGSKEAILAAARRSAQTHGYKRLNFRELAAEVGIKAASIYYYFPSKADLGAAVVRRYWEDTSAELEAIWADSSDPLMCLRRYPEIFRRSLEDGNRLCLGSFMSAEQQDLPDTVKHEVQTFADINVDWLDRIIFAINDVFPNSTGRARAIFAAVSGAQLLARSRADITVFDEIIENYREVGLLK